MQFTPISLKGTHSHQSAPSYSYYGRFTCHTPRGIETLNPGSQPMFNRTLTCNRPFTQLRELDFRDRLLKAPTSARSYDLPEVRVKKLSGTREDSFWLFSLSDQPFKDLPIRDLRSNKPGNAVSRFMPGS